MKTKKIRYLFSQFKSCVIYVIIRTCKYTTFESWYYNKPLISSNQFFDQLGDAAILVDLQYKKISDAILQIDNKDVVNKLISNGQRN